MKKKNKILLSTIVVAPIILITLVLTTTNKSDNYENLTNQGNLIAVYIQDENGEYKANNSSKFPTEGYNLNIELSTCKNGSTLSQDETTKLINLSTSFNDTCSLYFEKEKTIIDKIIAANKGAKTGFGSPATTDEGIYSMEDDYGTSYYYRGAVTNNYVKFGRNASGQDMYWRIIRINGDGSLRILYTGTQAYANGTINSDKFIGASAFNSSSNDIKYVGYMYGPAGTTASTSKEEAQTNTESSTIKTYIDNWYKTNIVDTGYSEAVSDVLFCNDRTTPGSAVTGWSGDTGLGYGTNYTAYGAYARSAFQPVNKANPTFKCPQTNDAFTVSDTSKGNGALTYPVGLITADEIVAAGSGQFGNPNNSYLYRPGYWWWSLSPSNSDSWGTHIMTVGDSGDLSTGFVKTVSGGVAPVINLSAEYVKTMVGEGTINSPYTVV